MKPYNEQDFEKSKLQFEALKPYFKHYQLIDDQDSMGIDVPVWYHGKIVCYLELEGKLHWKGEKFPFAKVNFLERKLKYKYLSRKAFWVLFNADLTSCCYIDIRKIDSDKLFMIEGKYGTETVAQIPLDQMGWGFDNIENWLWHQLHDCHD